MTSLNWLMDRMFFFKVNINGNTLENVVDDLVPGKGKCLYKGIRHGCILRTRDVIIYTYDYNRKSLSRDATAISRLTFSRDFRITICISSLYSFHYTSLFIAQKNYFRK